MPKPFDLQKFLSEHPDFDSKSLAERLALADALRRSPIVSPRRARGSVRTKAGLSSG